MKDGTLVNLFPFNSVNLDGSRIKNNECKKIRDIKFSVDDKMVVINDKNKIAYFTKERLTQKSQLIIDEANNLDSAQKDSSNQKTNKDSNNLKTVSKGEQSVWKKVIEGQAEIKQSDESMQNKPYNTQIEPVNFIYSSQMNLVANQPSVKNIFGCVNFTNDDNSNG